MCTVAARCSRRLQSPITVTARICHDGKCAPARRVSCAAAPRRVDEGVEVDHPTHEAPPLAERVHVVVLAVLRGSFNEKHLQAAQPATFAPGLRKPRPLTLRERIYRRWKAAQRHLALLTL